MKQLYIYILTASLGLSGMTSAQSDHGHHGTPQAGAEQNAMSEGEIKRVDKDSGRLTIKHGELKNVGMGAMTMAFKVQDPAMLDKVKPGDKVRFVVEKVGGALTVTTIDVAK